MTFPKRLLDLAGKRPLRYFLAEPGTEKAIFEAGQRLGVSLPTQVERFYLHYNGLRVDDPELVVLPLEQLSLVSPGRLHFAIVASSRHLFFDVSRLNEAEQWDIVTTDDFRVTVTMASFWSNRMWAWIEKRRPIWQDEGAT